MNGTIHIFNTSMQCTYPHLRTMIISGSNGNDATQLREPHSIVQRVQQGSIVWCLVRYDDDADTDDASNYAWLSEVSISRLKPSKPSVHRRNLLLSYMKFMAIG